MFAQMIRQVTRSYVTRAVIAGLSMLLAASVMAQATAPAPADTPEFEDPFLQTVAVALRAYDLDVVANLNARDLVRQRIRQPRFGRFPDLPFGVLPRSEEIRQWETEYAESQIAGVAILSTAQVGDLRSPDDYLEAWLSAPAEARIFVSLYIEDRDWAEKIQTVAGAYNYHVRSFFGGDVSPAAQLYATAAQRLGIDSRAARRYRSAVTELKYLGKRVRRNSNSLFRDDGNNGDRNLARNEPAVFLKQTLGDEFNSSTIREIIVPGGVALGETATLSIDVAAMIYAAGAMRLIDADGDSWQLPTLDSKALKALFDFTERARSIKSDAIVDIDGNGRVRISSALRDTDVGYEIMRADTQPFEFVPNLPVTKSLVIDIAVDWLVADSGNSLDFETGYEIRFLSANNVRIAQTRAALQYEYESASETASFQDSWGSYVGRLSDNLDYFGLGGSVAGVAKYAGWIALFRKLRDDEVPFVRGRYEFMKIDKTGRNTPSHY